MKIRESKDAVNVQAKEDVDAESIMWNSIFKEEYKMKIAVTYENGQVFQHFGHTSEFKIYDVEDNKVVSSAVVSTDGFGHESLAQFLANKSVDTLICGGIGGGTKNAVAAAGIKIYGGTSGNADEKVDNFLNKKLVFNPNVKCTHHDGEHHGEGHSCNGHCHE